MGDLLNTADLDQVRASGALLARLQDTLAAYPDADQLPALAVSSEPLTARVTGWLDSCAGHLPTAARNTLRGLVSNAPPGRLARQHVHFDFRSANILVADGEVAAILDFEEAQHDHRLVELARAAVLLGTRYHDWGPVPAEARAEFLSRGTLVGHPAALAGPRDGAARRRPDRLGTVGLSQLTRA